MTAAYKFNTPSTKKIGYTDEFEVRLVAQFHHITYTQFLALPGSHIWATDDQPDSQAALIAVYRNFSLLKSLELDGEKSPKK